MRKTEDSHATSEYAPLEAFWEGFVDHRDGLQRNPYNAVPARDVEAQAWDRGREASIRVSEAIGRVC